MLCEYLFRWMNLCGRKTLATMKGRFPGCLPVEEWQHLVSEGAHLDERPTVEKSGCTEAECEHCHLDEVEETRVFPRYTVQCTNT